MIRIEQIYIGTSAEISEMITSHPKEYRACHDLTLEKQIETLHKKTDKIGLIFMLAQRHFDEKLDMTDPNFPGIAFELDKFWVHLTD